MEHPVKTENVNNSFFKSIYKEIWKNIIPEKLTIAEVAFIQEAANLQQGNHVLDIMCGYGRHAIELARKGYQVTAIDSLREYIDEIKDISLSENLKIETIQDDVLNIKLEKKYDLAICMGNSLCFFDYDDTIELLQNLSFQLKKNGIFIFNSWAIAEIAIPLFKEKTWGYSGEVKMLSDNKYLFNPTRIETKSIFIAPDNSIETRNAIDYIYSYAEMESMLNKTNFVIKEAYSIPGKKKYAFGDQRLYVVAEKQ
ncbi:MAG: class I SAM-dependent methyltransferase [Bacteroidota bacterium]|nr:class I SAM-dependent methyltransferase [Bacteroidota bacterium]